MLKVPICPCVKPDDSREFLRELDVVLIFDRSVKRISTAAFTCCQLCKDGARTCDEIYASYPSTVFETLPTCCGGGEDFENSIRVQAFQSHSSHHKKQVP